MKTKFTALFVLLVVAVLASACGSSAPQGEAVSALTQDEAASLIENAMQGFKDGDYAVWSRDWSDAMKSGVNESAFLASREQVTSQVGQFVSIESVEIQPGMKKGYVRWVALCNFEKGKVNFIFGFLNEGTQVEGVFPEAVK